MVPPAPLPDGVVITCLRRPAQTRARCQSQSALIPKLAAKDQIPAGARLKSELWFT
jgi:hypothetical protein